MGLEQPLNGDDTRAVVAAIAEARGNSRVVVAVEVNPARRLQPGPWRIGTVDLISNGLLNIDRFTLKVEGETVEYVDIAGTFSHPVIRPTG